MIQFNVVFFARRNVSIIRSGSEGRGFSKRNLRADAVHFIRRKPGTNLVDYLSTMNNWWYLDWALSGR
jgi:hypothetical protein